MNGGSLRSLENKRCSSPQNHFSISSRIKIGTAALAPIREISIAHPRNEAESAFEKDGLDGFANFFSKRVFSLESSLGFKFPYSVDASVKPLSPILSARGIGFKVVKQMPTRTNLPRKAGKLAKDNSICSSAYSDRPPLSP